LVVDNWVIKSAHVKAESEGFDSPMEGQEPCASNGDQAAVQYTVEYKLRVRCNEVSSFAESPADRVQYPERPYPNARDPVGSLDPRA
jgi:hypothetical protein